jgi:hypothetical protein
MTLPRLQNCGELALNAVARSVEENEPLLRCQLLASEFYEALKRELRLCPHDHDNRAVLLAAAAVCSRAAIASTTPPDLLRELRNAVDMLAGRRPMMPMLRVIQGGKA